MTTASILSSVHSAIAAQSTDDTFAILRQLADGLAAQIRTEFAAQKGVSSPARKANALIKAFRKAEMKSLKPRDALCWPWYDSDARQCWTNGYFAFRFNKPLPLDPRPADSPVPDNFVNLGSIIPKSLNAHKGVPLPTQVELKAFIATYRAEHGPKAVPVWDLGFQVPLVNATLLLDMMQLFPDATEVYVQLRTVKPLVFRTPAGDGLLLPLQPTPAKAAEFTQPAQESPAAVEEAPEALPLRDVTPSEVTPSWHFTPSTVTTGDGQAFPAEYSLTPSGAVLVFWSDGSTRFRLRVLSTDALNPVVLAAARPAEAPQAVEEPPKASDQVDSLPALPAPAENALQASQEAPQAVDPAPMASDQVETSAAAPVLALPAPAVAALLPAPSPKNAHGPVPEKTFVGTSIEGSGWRISFDGDAQRTRVILTVKSKRLAAAIEDAGFCWSPRTQSYNKKLTFRAYRAAQALAQSLRSLTA